MKEIIGIIGAGSYGSALGHAIAASGREVLFWARDPNIIHDINHNGRNKKYAVETFAGRPPRATNSLQEIVASCQTLLYSCPSSHFLETLRSLKTLDPTPSYTLVNTAKGFDLEKTLLFDQRVREIFGRSFWKTRFAVLSGPGFSKEIIDGHPTCLTLAMMKRRPLKNLQAILGTRFLRVYGSLDLVGVQLGGAAKNVVAIACGIVEGLGFGLNTRTAIMNLGLAEIARLGTKMGAKAPTFRGFSGMGDLVLTCTGAQSRNRRFGFEIGTGSSPALAAQNVGATIEGISSSQALHSLARRHHIDLPLCDTVYKILHNHQNLQKSIDDLLSRPQLEEWR